MAAASVPSVPRWFCTSERTERVVKSLFSSTLHALRVGPGTVCDRFWMRLLFLRWRTIAAYLSGFATSGVIFVLGKDVF